MSEPKPLTDLSDNEIAYLVELEAKAQRDMPADWRVVPNANYGGHRIDAKDGTNIFLGSSTHQTCEFITEMRNCIKRLLNEVMRRREDD